MKKTYKIEVDCPVCAGKMEEQAKKQNGIKDAAVSFLTQKMKVEFEDNADTAQIMKELKAACRKIEPDCEIYTD